MDRLDNRRAVSPTWIWLGELAGQRGLWPLLALALILLVDAVISPGFFSVRIVEGGLYGSLIDVLYRGTPTALVALGMAVVIGTKGIDLSVGAVIAIVGAVMTDLIHRDLAAPAVLALTLTTGLLCGLWNGFLVAILDIQPIIATFVVSWLFLRRTALGLCIEVVGGNTAAANLAGVEAKAVKIVTYMLSGRCSAIAGVLKRRRARVRRQQCRLVHRARCHFDGGNRWCVAVGWAI